MRNHLIKKVEIVTIKKKIWFIQKYRHEHKLTVLLRVMKLSKSTYFENVNRTQSNQTIYKQKLCEQIKLIHEESAQVFGARKITKLLNKAGTVITSLTLVITCKNLNYALSER